MIVFFWFTDVLREMVLTYQSECVHTIVPVLTQVHLAFQESNIPGNHSVREEVICAINCIYHIYPYRSTFMCSHRKKELWLCFTHYITVIYPLNKIDIFTRYYFHCENYERVIFTVKITKLIVTSCFFIMTLWCVNALKCFRFKTNIRKENVFVLSASMQKNLMTLFLYGLSNEL
jgi:hypothetical protein